MTFLQARSQYRIASSDEARVPDDPHGIVLFTLRQLERSLRVLAACAEGGRPYPDTHLTRGLTAIYVLQSSLNFDAGGDMANDLFQVYEYCRQQVLAAFSRSPDPQLQKAADLVSSLSQAWEQIGGQAAPTRAAAG